MCVGRAQWRKYVPAAFWWKPIHTRIKVLENVKEINKFNGLQANGIRQRAAICFLSCPYFRQCLPFVRLLARCFRQSTAVGGGCSDNCGSVQSYFRNLSLNSSIGRLMMSSTLMGMEWPSFSSREHPSEVPGDEAMSLPREPETVDRKRKRKFQRHERIWQQSPLRLCDVPLISCPMVGKKTSMAPSSSVEASGTNPIL